MPTPWQLPAEVDVEGVRYPVRLDARGFLEVRVHGEWVGQSLYQVYDDASANMVAAFLVAWARTRSRTSFFPMPRI